MQLDYTFTATLTVFDDMVGPSWIVVYLPDSKEFFGTGKAVKVTGTVDGHPISSAFMPSGRGGHFLAMSAALRKKLGKDAGDEVTVHPDQRLS
jgi:hypothetical protein